MLTTIKYRAEVCDPATAENEKPTESGGFSFCRRRQTLGLGI